MKQNSWYMRFFGVVIAGILAAINFSCTKNNGDIGVWFGLWKVSSITVDGTADRKYKVNMFFAFQNTAFEQKIVADDHSTMQEVGVWEESGRKIVVTFPDSRYEPADGYMLGGGERNELSYEVISSTRINLTLVTPQEKTVVYALEKW